LEGHLSHRLHDAFVEHGTFLRNWTPATIRTYKQGLRAFDLEVPTKADLDAWVIRLRSKGLSPGGCNMYIRTINAYLTWLFEQHQTPDHLRIKTLRAPLKQLTLLSDADVHRLVVFKPLSRLELRTHALTLTLLDTGIRITEAITLTRAHVNLDQQFLTVSGKGRKERVVPCSPELRKVLWKYLQTHTSDWAFPTRERKDDTASRHLSQRNAFRDIVELCDVVGITSHVHPHLFRHTYAATFIRQRGDLFRLSRILGHTAITTTQMYLRSLGVADLMKDEARISPLTSR
jgi:integrase/recombinase XerD